MDDYDFGPDCDYPHCQEKANDAEAKLEKWQLLHAETFKKLPKTHKSLYMAMLHEVETENPTIKFYE